MLAPAQLYKEELQTENIKTWYLPENIYYNFSTGNDYIEILENNYNCHQFVSVNKNNNIIGYISYDINWEIMSVTNLGIISFQRGNINFIKDVYQAITDIFEKYHMKRLEWFCIKDNPVLKSYEKKVLKFGGSKCGEFTQSVKLMDGKLHDCVYFEILSTNFLLHKNNKNFGLKEYERKVKMKDFFDFWKTQYTNQLYSEQLKNLYVEKSTILAYNIRKEKILHELKVKIPLDERFNLLNKEIINFIQIFKLNNLRKIYYVILNDNIEENTSTIVLYVLKQEE